MLDAHAKLYIPISANTLQAVVTGESNNYLLSNALMGGGFEFVDLTNVLAKLANHEIACLFFLMHLPQLQPDDSSALEQLMFECIKACHLQNAHVQTNTSLDGATDSQNDEFIAFCVEQLDTSKIRTGYERLAEYKVAPIDEQTLLEKEFLDDSGMWDFEFCRQHRQSLQQDLVEVKIRSQSVLLSAEQSRIYRELMAGEDEHIHIQGYAGTGKTTLIKSLISLFENTSAKLLVLAERKNQLDVFIPMVTHSDRVQVITYTDLAKLIITSNSSEGGEETILRKGMTRATMPDSDIIRHLGIISSGAVHANQLVKVVRGSVFSFCQSDADELTVQHIPKRYRTTLDAATQGAVCQYATRLWQSILSPPTIDFTPQIRAYHIIKWAALNRCVIPDEFTHVLIDECHDLSATLNQILSNSSQARISLGDDYQNLSGSLMKSQGIIRQREMHHSLRSSHQVDNLINPIIAAHPSRVNATFFGNRMNRLELEYYEKASVPKDPSLILVSDLWGLFEWTQRMASGKLAINFLSSVSDLDVFVQDCIELYSNGTRARHGQLFRFTSWQQLSRHYQSNPAFIRVSRMLERNYSQQDWQQTRSCISSNSTAVYSLALVENVRNLEYDSVMLSPQILTKTDISSQVDRNKQMANASFYAALYVAVTRARKKLIVPELLRNHIEEIS